MPPQQGREGTENRRKFSPFFFMYFEAWTRRDEPKKNKKYVGN